MQRYADTWCSWMLVPGAHVRWYLVQLYPGTWCSCTLVPGVTVRWYPVQLYPGTWCSCTLVHGATVPWYLVQLYAGTWCTWCSLHAHCCTFRCTHSLYSQNTRVTKSTIRCDCRKLCTGTTPPRAVRVSLVVCDWKCVCGEGGD